MMVDRRLENSKLNEVEFSLQKEVIQSHPVSVVVPTGTRCNVNCIFCTERDSHSNYEYQDISFDEFLNYLEPAHLASQIGLYGWGEPFINSEYEEMFDHLTKQYPGIEVIIATNGILFSNHWAQKLVAHENVVLNFSLNAANPKTYQLLTGYDGFKKVVDNIRYLKKLKIEKNSSSPSIALSFVAMKQNVRELPAFVELAATVGADYVLVQDLMILREAHAEHSLHNENGLAKTTFLQAAQKAKTHKVIMTLFAPTPYLPARKEEVCAAPWKSFMISINGDVRPCCFSQKPMGNIFEQNWTKIWNGDNYQDYRKAVNTENPPVDCQSCPRKKFIATDMHEVNDEIAIDTTATQPSAGPTLAPRPIARPAPPRPPTRPAPPRPL